MSRATGRFDNNKELFLFLLADFMNIAKEAKQPDNIVIRSSGLYNDAVSLGYTPTFRKTLVPLVSRPKDSRKKFILGLFEV
jgi:hypothetical protein